MQNLHSDLFGHIPKRDFLSLNLAEGHTDYRKVVDYLGFNKEEVAKATNLPKDSVRYDNKMSQELVDRINEWATALQLVAGYFGGDVQKTTLWFSIPNPSFGYIAPRDMIRFGRFKKLYKFIIDALKANTR